MSAAVDRGRAAVYAAEIAAFEGTTRESPVSFESLVALARQVCSAGWWPHGDVAVMRARADARSSSARTRSAAATIRLAAPQMTQATLIHELAHVLAGPDAGHSARFRRAHVDLAGWAFGPDPADWLLDAYTAIGLDVGRRHWPAPPRRSGLTPTAREVSD